MLTAVSGIIGRFLCFRGFMVFWDLRCSLLIGPHSWDLILCRSTPRPRLQKSTPAVHTSSSSSHNHSLFPSFLHSQTPAGTTLFLSLLDYANRTNLGFVRCMRTVSPKSCVLWSGDRSMGLRHAHVITGHMPLAMDQRVAGLIERPYAVLAVLRDPISRMVSFFNFKQPNAGGAHGFLQWYLSQAQRHSCNLMTAYMAGLEAGPEDVYGGRCAAVSENALFKAQQNLATSITFLGTQARYDELVLQLACFLGTDDLAKQLLFGTHITPHERTVPGFRPVTAADFDPLLLDQVCA